MEIHNRFMSVPTTAVTLLLGSLGENPKAIWDLNGKYNEKIRNGAAGSETLQAFHMILCYEYQSLHNACLEKGQNVLKSQANPLETSDIDIKNFIVTSDESCNAEDRALLYEILVLQLVITVSPQQFTKLFDSFHETYGESLAASDDTLNVLLKVSECFADSYNLCCRLLGILGDEGELEKQRTRIQSTIKLWMKQEDVDWKLLASLLPKLTLAFGSDKIVSPLWDEAFNNRDDLGTLNALCVMADACFPCEKNMVREIHYEQCMQEKFWSVVVRGLTSGIFQYRKQALYLMKRAVDFIESHESTIRMMLKSSRENIVPFVCARLLSTDPSIERPKKFFFLILEALEEKQKHLVLPALSHLQTLLKMYADHKACGDCFNVIWLRCILQRILEHDNEAIKIFGLTATLESDFDIFDESFMYFLANVLNNTFLYELDTRKDMAKYNEPQIVELLRNFFERSEKAGVHLINTFIRAISRVSWCPVALIWLFRAVQISETEILYNVWTPEELERVAALVEKNLTMHSLELRILSHDRIVSSFKTYVRQPLSQENLELVINTLSSFPDEAPERTSITWWRVVDLLSVMVEASDAALYVTGICDTFFDVERNMKSLARIIALLLDSKLICRTITCPAERALRQLFENLIGADLRPYADPASILAVIEFVSYLINLGSQHKSKGMDTMKRLVSPYGNAIIKVIGRSLERKTNAKHDEYLLAITALVNSIDSVDASGIRVPWWPDTEKQLERFEDKCMHIIANPDDFVQWCYAIKVLYLCREKTFSRRPKLGEMYITPLLEYFKSVIHLHEHEGELEKQNGLPNSRLASNCFETVAKIVRQVVTESPSDHWPPDVSWFEELRNFVETGSEEVIEPVAATLYELLEKSSFLAEQDLDTLNSIIRQCWRGTFQLKRTQLFFSTITQLTRLIINSNFLKLDGSKEYAVECANEMMKEGERVPLLKRIFLTSVGSLSPRDISIFRKQFMSCLLHGFVPQRDKRIEQQTIMACSDYLALSEPVPTVDISLRAQSVIILLNVLISPEAAEFRGNLLTDLLGLLEQNKNKRYFDNSHLHRLKHRAMQTLLILEPCLNKTEIQVLHDVMCDLVIAESNQPSVRFMQEWILARIYVQNPPLRDLIWNVFAMAVEKRPGSIVSLASIVCHVSRLLAGDTRTEYVTKAIAHLLPNCMGQQFNVRLYSQTILGEIYSLLPFDSSERAKYKAIYEAVQESLNHGSLMKNSTRIFDNFYFSHFHINNSYSLETIYYHFSRLTNVSEDEWIECRVFRELHAWPHPSGLPLYDITHLASAQVMLKSTKAAGELTEDTCPSIDEGLSDIQKKIIPWKSMVPFYDDLSEISKAPLSRRKFQNEDAGIIVVASLIDRPANLGGLARTCEIFGAKELVMDNLRSTEDREFQALSVTAEKWITITEVKPHLLRNYLLEKQSKGWELVGAEQTANSTNLLDMKFDKKSILLLGNEKDGIPANLIPLLDICVEIPQNGVVRSLNVHVTGAICIWQYFKQHIRT